MMNRSQALVAFASLGLAAPAGATVPDSPVPATPSGPQQRHPPQVAGGALDDGVADQADAFLADPRPARAMPGCRVAAEYVARIQQGRYSEVASLFAENASFLEPIRRAAIQGRARIDAFYREAIGRARPEIMAVAYVAGPGECMVELAVKRPVAGVPRWTVGSIDHFRFGRDGKVTDMVAFVRPTALAPVIK